MLRPTGVALSRLAGRGQYIDTRLAISLQPELVTEPGSTVKPVPLPPLGHYQPLSAGLNLHLDMDLDFATLNQRLADTFAGKSFVIKGQQAGISKFDLGGSGQEISARIELTGEIAGTAKLRARLVYDAQDRQLVLQDLTFDYAAEDFTLGLLTKALHEPIRQALESAANQALTQHLDQLSERIGTVLEKITPAGVELDMSDLQLRSVQIHIMPQGIRLDGTATGNARLVLH